MCKCGLAGAGGAIKYNRDDLVIFNEAPERLVLAEKMRLAEKIPEILRLHPPRERSGFFFSFE